MLSLCLLFKLPQLLYKSELLITCSKFTGHLPPPPQRPQIVLQSRSFAFRTFLRKKSWGKRLKRQTALLTLPTRGPGLPEWPISGQVQNVALTLGLLLSACGPNSISPGRKALSSPPVGGTGPRAHWLP